MEVTGKLIQKLPVQSGVSSSGNNWSKAEFVIETVEQYPKKICANLWGDRARALDQFQEGSLITVSFDLESREFNGRWYTDVKAWKVEARRRHRCARARIYAAAAAICTAGLCPAAADVSASRLSSTTPGLCATSTGRLSASTPRVCARSPTRLSGTSAAFFFRPTATRYEHTAQYSSGDVHRRGRRG